MTRRRSERTPFSGFDRPESNYFRMPNTWTDITAEIDNIAELKVVEYILRHTWGYQEYGLKKHITIDEFVNGRRRQDGSRMDKGTGLSERAVYDGLRKAVENSLIEEEIDDSDRGRIKKSYSLRMRENAHAGEELQSLQSGVQSLHPHLQDLHPDPQTLQVRGASDAPRTEKDTQERHSIERHPSNFERSHDQVEGSEKRPGATLQPTHPTGALNGSAALTGFQRTTDRGSAAGPTSLKDLIARRRQSSRGPRRGRPAGSSEDRERLRPFLEDFARELGDEAPLSSTITRTLTIFKAAGVPPERWSDLLYQARGLTQEHTAQIRKMANTGADQFRRKNKMPYFLATLEQVVGLRPPADTPRQGLPSADAPARVDPDAKERVGAPRRDLKQAGDGAS
jgi:DNA-binding PadR family transcriptional regulator